MYSPFDSTAWKPRRSVKVRFALVQGFFIAAIVGLLAVTLYITVRPRFVTTIDGSYKLLVNNLGASIYTTFQAGNRDQVVAAVRKVEGQQGVAYVLLTDEAGEVYYDSFTGTKSLQGKNYTDSLDESLKSTHDTVVGKVERDGEQYYIYAFPWTIGDKIPYTIRLAVPTVVLDGEFDRLALLFLYLGGFGIALGILASYFLMNRMTKPIIALTESALAIRAGNLNAYPDIETNDELEQLSREFQGMVEKLKQFYFQEYRQKKEAVDSKKRLEEINDRLQSLDRQKTDFLNTASHQLRTPLSVIHWSLSMIVDEASHLNLSKDQLELLQESLKSTKRMVDMVNGLLDISRIEQGRKELNWSKGNYGTVCSDLVAALQPLAIQKGLQLTYQADSAIPDSFLDAKAYYEVVNNFVDNAIKYTPTGFVKVHSVVSGDHIDIKIEDSGIGMDDEEKQKLFERFARGKEASKLFANGSGLGMYVARAILEQHGGSITVESEKGKGTQFTLTMPIYNEPPTPGAGSLTDESSAQYQQVGATTTLSTTNAAN